MDTMEKIRAHKALIANAKGRPGSEIKRRFLSFADLEALGIRYSKSQLYRLISSGRFPSPIPLADGPRANVGFVAEEIEAWITRRIEKFREESRDMANLPTPSDIKRKPAVSEAAGSQFAISVSLSQRVFAS